MNKVIKRRWLKALRSGKYKQTVGRLQVTQEDVDEQDSDHPAGFCCLGVLCEVQGAEYEHDAGHPPNDVADSAGLNYDQMQALTFLNDGIHNDSSDHLDGKGRLVLTGFGEKPILLRSRKPRSFKKIADFIEKYL